MKQIKLLIVGLVSLITVSCGCMQTAPPYEYMQGPGGNQMVACYDNSGTRFMMDYLLFSTLMRGGGYGSVINHYHSYPGRFGAYSSSAYGSYRPFRGQSYSSSSWGGYTRSGNSNSSFRSTTKPSTSGSSFKSTAPTTSRPSSSGSSFRSTTPSSTGRSTWRSSSSGSSSRSSGSSFRSSSSSGGRRR